MPAIKDPDLTLEPPPTDTESNDDQFIDVVDFGIGLYKAIILAIEENLLPPNELTYEIQENEKRPILAAVQVKEATGQNYIEYTWNILTDILSSTRCFCLLNLDILPRNIKNMAINATDIGLDFDGYEDMGVIRRMNIEDKIDQLLCVKTSLSEAQLKHLGYLEITGDECKEACFVMVFKDKIFPELQKIGLPKLRENLRNSPNHSASNPFIP